MHHAGFGVFANPGILRTMIAVLQRRTGANRQSFANPLANALSRHVDRPRYLRDTLPAVVTQQNAHPLRLPSGGRLGIPQALQLENLFLDQLQLWLGTSPF
jgi:hypothetical protein